MALARESSNQILDFLRERGKATRRELNVECFKGRAPKARIDAAIEHLLAATPPRISVQLIPRSQEAPGAPTTVYHPLSSA